MDTKIYQENYDILNDEQRQAVESIYGPTMVVAGPGTWKTQIIGLRTANIILKWGVNPDNILITTFTEAWVIAIRERLLKFIWEDAYKVWVSTIHSFSSDVIKTFPEKFIEYKASSAIDDVDSLEIIKWITDELIKNKGLEYLYSDFDNYLYLRDIKSRIGTLKQEWVSLAKYEKLIENQKIQFEEELWEIKPTLKKYEKTKLDHEKKIWKMRELLIFYKRYNEILRKTSRYDFNDMINFVLEKFTIDDDLRYYYAEKYQFIMLDEYQDTNNAQNQIIDLILSETPEKPNIMVVWDDDQSIYRFQGANIENMLDFSTKYSDTEFIVLKNNYRSVQNILDLSSFLIENNQERLSNKIDIVEKELVAFKWKSDNDPGFYLANNEIDERRFVINKIKSEIELWIPVEEIAIIVRWNREVENWTNVLMQNWIEVESKLKTNILKTDFINLILKYLRVISNPYENEEALIDLMRSSISGLNQSDVFKINRLLYIKNYSNKFKLKMIDFLSELNLDEMKNNQSSLFYHKWQNLDNLKFDLKSFIEFRDTIFDFNTKIVETNLVSFFNYFIEETWILEYIETHKSFDDLQDIYTLFNKIKAWNESDNSLNVNKLLSKLDLYKEYNYSINRQILKKASSWIQVMTAHSSKWLEYNTVFIPGLYNWNWEWKRVIDKLKLPSWVAWDWLQFMDEKEKKMLDKEKALEEDRRLFFVAITRAKNNLFLSFPAGIWTKPLLPSLFLEEFKWLYDDITNNETKDDNQLYEIASNDLINSLLEYSDWEFDYISEFLDNYKMSPSDLNVFLKDPLEFLNRVVFKYPFEDNEFTIFWKVYHRTLELFYLKYKNEGELPEESYLTITFKMLIDKEILTHDEKEKLIEKWLVWLEWYYKEYSRLAKPPVELEYSFRRKNIFFEWIPLSWTIDKIELSDEVNTENNQEISSWSQLAFFKEKVSLIDYKTWKIKSKWVLKWVDRMWNKKEWEWNYFRQLLFYKLLCESDNDFVSKFDVWDLVIDFVEWKDWVYKKVIVEYTPEEYEEFKTELIDCWNKIKDINFWKDILKK